jgi:hypothetical protein
MSSASAIEGFMIFGSIVLLLSVGALIAIRSGVGELNTCRDYLLVAGNLSQMALRVLGYVLILLVVQYLIGLRPSLGW